MSESNLAFLFPGQGSQKVGMLSDMAEKYSVVTDTFAEASEVLGFDAWDMIQNGEQETLNLTENTQPLLLTSSVALWRVWQQEEGPQPSIMAGHSLGEFSALVCSGSIQFADGVDLVRDRGRFMQTAVPVGQGAMAAVLGLDDADIDNICSSISKNDVVEAVNYNSPGQVVIAGTVAGVDAAIEACKEAGAKRAMPLPVSAPFHTSLMKPAGEQLEEKLSSIMIVPPSIPVVHNVHAQTETNAEEIKKLLVQQIYSPVKWVSCIEAIASSGVTSTVECGPGKVLAGLNKRINKSLSSASIESPDDLAKALSN